MSAVDQDPTRNATRDWLRGYADAAWDRLDGMPIDQQVARLTQLGVREHPKWFEGYAAGVRRIQLQGQSATVATEAIERAGLLSREIVSTNEEH